MNSACLSGVQNRRMVAGPTADDWTRRLDTIELCSQSRYTGSGKVSLKHYGMKCSMHLLMLYVFFVLLYSGGVTSVVLWCSLLQMVFQGFGQKRNREATFSTRK